MPSGDGRFAPQRDVPLAPLSTLRVGGPARWFACVAAADDIALAHRWCLAEGLPMLVLGGGSNVVIADRGFDGLVVRMDVRGIELARDAGDTILRAGAGEPWDGVVASAIARGLAGLECLSGIPGSTGGTPIQNVGAYGQEVAQSLDRVEAYDCETCTPVELGAASCGFGYRTSRFKADDTGRFVICRVSLRLRPGPATVTYPDVVAQVRDAGVKCPALADVRDAVLRIRRRKGMVLDEADADTRSVGSFFTNPVVSLAAYERIAAVGGTAPPAFPAGEGYVKVPAAWLIERSGFLRGTGEGAAGLSTKHPLAIVNRGGATGRDIVRLAARIARAVEDRFGVRLRPEPVFVGFGDDDSDVAFLLGTGGGAVRAGAAG